MFTVTWLRMSAIGLPLIGAFIIWRWGGPAHCPAAVAAPAAQFKTLGANVCSTLMKDIAIKSY